MEMKDYVSILRSRFIRNISQNVATSVCLLGITFCTTPFMTRLYPPEAYGVSGMMARGAMIVSGIGLLGLPVALARTHGPLKQQRLLSASMTLGALLSVLSIAGWIALPRLILGAPRAVVALFPLLVFAYCVNLIARSFGTANGLFPALSNGRLVDGIGSRILSLLGGLAVPASALIMILADITGKAVGTAVIIRSCRDRLSFRPLAIHGRFARLASTVSDYRDHAVYSNLAQILPSLAIFVVEASIARRFGINDVGQYTLASSILGLPVALIALASAPIVFHRLAAEVDKPNSGRFNQLSFAAFLCSLGLGALLMMPFIVFGPSLFGLFFGKRWYTAGQIAQTLAVPFIFNFSYTILLGIFQAKNTLKIWFFAELCSASVFLLATVANTKDIVQFAIYLSGLYLIRFCLLHLAFLISAARSQYQ